MAPHTIILPPPCLTVGKRHSFLYLSPSLRRTYTLRLLPNCSNLDSSVHNTLYQSSFVHFLCSFANFRRFTLFFSFSNGFFAAILPTSPSSPSFRRTVLEDTVAPLVIVVLISSRSSREVFLRSLRLRILRSFTCLSERQFWCELVASWRFKVYLTVLGLHFKALAMRR